MSYYKLVPTASFEQTKTIQQSLSIMGVDYLMMAKQKADNEFRLLFLVDDKAIAALNGTLPIDLASNGAVVKGFVMAELREPLSKIAKEFFGLSI